MSTIDQAPKPNENEPINQTSTPSERVRTSTGDTPAYAGYEPHRSEMNPSEYSKTRRAALLGVGAILSLGAALGLADKAATTDIPGITSGDANSEEYSYDVNGSGGDSLPYVNAEIDTSNIDIATYPNSSFVDLAPATQLRLCHDYFEQGINDGAYQKWANDVDSINTYPVSGGIGTGSIYDDPQQIENRALTKEYIILNDTNFNRAENASSCLFDQDSEAYETLMGQIGQGGSKIPSWIEVFYSSDVFTQGSIGRTNANGTPTRVMTVSNQTTNDVFNVVFQERTSDTDPSIKETVFVDAISPYSETFVERVDMWDPTK